MSKIGIVTDTVGCIPADFIKEHDIRRAPVGLVIDGKGYLDTDLTNEEFWRMFHAAKEPTSTSAVAPGAFADAFADLTKTTDSIICIVVSKALSATHEAAVEARDIVQKEHPNLKIEIIDSNTATGAEGFIVMEVARAIKAGKSLEEVIQIARDMIPKVKWLMGMETLKYLIRIGRAPKVAMIGDFLDIKPIVGMVSGKGVVENIGRARGKRKAVVKLADMIPNYADTTKPLHLNVHYTDGIAAGEEFRDMITARYNCTEVHLTPFTPVMCSATGPVLAVAFYTE